MGSCHCGNIKLTFESDIDPRQIKVRSCQCTFCRKHGSRAVSDPNGMLTICVADQEHLNRYTFAYGTAEFLLCRVCGVYVAVATLESDEKRALAQLKVLDDQQQFLQHAIAVDYSRETRGERILRRSRLWTPVSIEIS